MMRPHDRDDAVSEVLGTVLIVAVTVIVAAVLASITSGFAWVPDFTANAVVAERSGTDIIFTNYGGGGTGDFQEIRCWINGTTPCEYNCVLLGTQPGSTAVNRYASTGPDRVIVVGISCDGTRHVLLDRWI